MTQHSAMSCEEPVIAVGLLDQCEAVRIDLQGPYQDLSGHLLPAGELHVDCRAGRARLQRRLARRSP